MIYNTVVLARTQPELVESAIFVDISPVQTSPSLHSMGALFEAMLNVRVPAELSLSAGRRVAGEQLADTLHPSTQQFILMNLVKDPVDGT